MALQQATGLVSPRLVRDIHATLNGTTLKQDLQTQLKAAED
jgi:hypothetical protein